jgi:ketosteroid isomerase-like protein
MSWRRKAAEVFHRFDIISFPFIGIRSTFINRYEELFSMRNLVTIAALALTIGVGACSGPPPQEFTRADGEAIRSNAASLTSAFNEKQVDKIIALYDDNSVFMPPNAPVLRGREPLKSFYSGLIAKGGSDLKMDVESVAGYGPLAYESGSYTIAYQAGGRDRGKYLRVLRKMNDTWRVEYTIWSSDLPKPAGVAAD